MAEFPNGIIDFRSLCNSAEFLLNSIPIFYFDVQSTFDIGYGCHGIKFQRFNSFVRWNQFEFPYNICKSQFGFHHGKPHTNTSSWTLSKWQISKSEKKTLPRYLNKLFLSILNYARIMSYRSVEIGVEYWNFSWNFESLFCFHFKLKKTAIEFCISGKPSSYKRCLTQKR